MFTVVALCLPVIAATFFSNSFFRLGNLRPGEVVYVDTAQIAHAGHVSPASSSTTTITPGATTTGTPQPGCTPSFNAAISITDSSFNPSSITVAPATRVTWTNNGTRRHRVRDINHVLFDSDDLQPGQSFSYVFCTPGTYEYEDARDGFRGVVIVSGTPPTGTVTAQPTGSATAQPTGSATAQPTGSVTAQPTGTPGGGLVHVSIFNDDEFSPPHITVQSGTTVRWTNYHDDEHTVTSPGNFNSGDIHPGQFWDHTFIVNGTYNYFCAYHPEMQGSVTVIGGPTATPQPTGTPGGGTQNVVIQDFAFQPQNLNIVVGTTVRWTNNDPYPHTATSPGNFDSGTLNQGQSYQHTFNTPGTYNYFCAVHPNMTGSIIVSGSSGTPQPTQTGQPQPTQTQTQVPTRTQTRTAQPTTTPAPGIVPVNILNGAYSPSTITVQAGTTVRWTNSDPYPHTVTSTDNPPRFDSGTLNQGQSWQYTFNTPGTYEYYCTLHGRFMVGYVVVVPAGSCTVSFSDVPTDHTFYPYVRCLACQNILGGYSDGTFRPGNPITRGQLSKIVANAAGFNEAISGQSFSDVPPTHTFYVYIERLARRGIIGGYSDGTFRSGDNATRGQIAKIVANAAGFREPISGQTFEDVPPTHTFYVYIERMARRGIIGGYSDGTFRPDNTATRGQVAKIVANTFFPDCQP
jgi:plastocyanin